MTTQSLRPSNRIDLLQFLRIFLPSLLTVILFAIIIYAVVFPIVDRVIHEHEKDKVRELVQVVQKILDRIHASEISGFFTRDRAQRIAIDMISNLKYGEENRDYFWVHDLDWVMLYHPHYEPNDESVYDNVDLQGRPLFEAFDRVADEGGGFVEYEWQWSGYPARYERKVSYLQRFEPWGWNIGTGYYLIDARVKSAKIRQNLTYILLISLLFVIGIALFTIRQLWERERLNQQLQEQLQHSMKLEAVGKLAGGVAHDFNNILTVIEGYVDLALRRPALDEGARRDLGTIRKAAERAESITRQLLAFSRQQIIAPRQMNLNDIVENTRRMLERIIGEDIDVRTTLDPNLGHIMADPNQIEQILMNLAVNSREAMPNGGTFSIETRNITLDKHDASKRLELAAGEYVQLTVGDSGVGMDKATLERVFEPFFTTREVGKGTGLGLSTVYGVVKQNHGDINVWSEQGAGTVFSIYLPRVQNVESDDSAQTVSESHSIPHGTETVLLVEDDAEVLTLTKTTLEQYGYNVVSADNPLEAIHLCERHPDEIHLLITDIIMPKLSGRQLAKQTRRIRPHMKTLYMSGYTDNVIAHHGALEQNIWFIQKPFQPASFLQKVREVLDSDAEA